MKSKATRWFELSAETDARARAAWLGGRSKACPLSSVIKRMKRYREAAAPSYSSRFLPFVSLPPENTDRKSWRKNANAAFRIDARACGHRVHNEPREKRGGLPFCAFVGAGGAEGRAGSGPGGRSGGGETF